MEKTEPENRLKCPRLFLKLLKRSFTSKLTRPIVSDEALAAASSSHFLH